MSSTSDSEPTESTSGGAQATSGPSPKAPSSGYTSGQKWWASVILAVLFFALASNPAFGFTGSLLNETGGRSFCSNGNDFLLLLLHTFVFFIIVRFFLGWIQ